MKSSIEKVRSSLAEEKRPEFDEALQGLAFSNIDFGDLAEASEDEGGFEEKLRSSINGKSAQQIISEADEIRIERERRQREQALEEIGELEAKLKEAESAKRELEKFEVSRSRFYKEEQSFGGDQPIIELTVRNGTDQAVSRAYFEGVLASPGRSVPWHKDTFNYSISGGLEPGEEAAWKLAPNMFSDWGEVDAPGDAVFTVTVRRLDGADEEPIYDARGLSDSQRERLAELKSKYGVE